VREEFVVDLRGKQFVLFAGLLDMAHELGLTSITTELLQVPTTENGEVAICKAVVRMVEEGHEPSEFHGLGDASPRNVGKAIAPHIIRMSETRAVARALRLATNIGITSLEEIGGEETEEDTEHEALIQQIEAAWEELPEEKRPDYEKVLKYASTKKSNAKKALEDLRKRKEGGE
jgi:hypothetical protein